MMGRSIRQMLLFAMVFGLFSLFYSWSQSYPVYLHSRELPLFASIFPLYWFSYPVLAVCLTLSAFTQTSKLTKWAASVGFFALLYSLSYFYYSTPGSDPFFRDLYENYFRTGFIDPQFSKVYEWPGFFLLTRVFVEVTGLSMQKFELLYYFLSGIMLSSSIFFIAQKHRLEPFWAVVAYSITGYYFLNYQFAPQTLGLVFVMILLELEYVHRSGFAENVLKFIFVAATAIFHSFIGFFYVLYLLVKGLYDQKDLLKAASAFATFVAVDVFLTASSFPKLVRAGTGSLVELLGLYEYSQRVSITLQAASPFPIQQLSRLSLLSALVVSAIGLAALIRRREFLRQDIAILTTAVFFFLIGFGVSFIGLRTLQLAAVVAALGAGYFPRRVNRPSIRVFITLCLVLSSTFIVMHANYDRYLYQAPDDVTMAKFISSRITLGRTGPPLRIYLSYMLRGFIGLGGELPIYNVEVWCGEGIEAPPPRVDYALISVVTERFLTVRGQTYPQAVSYVMNHGNLILSYGNGAVYTMP